MFQVHEKTDHRRQEEGVGTASDFQSPALLELNGDDWTCRGVGTQAGNSREISYLRKLTGLSLSTWLKHVLYRLVLLPFNDDFNERECIQYPSRSYYVLEATQEVSAVPTSEFTLARLLLETLLLL